MYSSTVILNGKSLVGTGCAMARTVSMNRNSMAIVAFFMANEHVLVCLQK
jgi:hypothetical protein